MIFSKTRYNKIVKNQRQKENPKVAREKKIVIYKETPIKPYQWISSKTLPAMRAAWDDTFKALKKKKNCQ